MTVPCSSKDCGVDRQVHDIFGAGPVASRFKRNRNQVRCAFCGAECGPGEAYRLWCKRHQHVLWVGCWPDVSDEMTVDELLRHYPACAERGVAPPRERTA